MEAPAKDTARKNTSSSSKNKGGIRAFRIILALFPIAIAIHQVVAAKERGIDGDSVNIIIACILFSVLGFIVVSLKPSKKF